MRKQLTTIALALGLAGDYRALRQITAGARPLPSPWPEMVDRIRRQLGIRRVVRVIESVREAIVTATRNRAESEGDFSAQAAANRAGAARRADQNHRPRNTRGISARSRYIMKILYLKP